MCLFWLSHNQVITSAVKRLGPLKEDKSNIKTKQKRGMNQTTDLDFVISLMMKLQQQLLGAIKVLFEIC